MNLTEYRASTDSNKFWKLETGEMKNLLDDAIERIAELEIWTWSENSDDGSHYNPALDRICKAVILTGRCDDWMRLRAALAQAMANELS